MNCEHKNKAYLIEKRDEILDFKEGRPTIMGNVTRIYTHCADCGLLIKEVKAKYA